MKKIIFVSVCLFLFLQDCCAQYNITGIVTDEQQQPLSGVTVTAGKRQHSTITDSTGNYSFAVSSENINLSFSCIGYESVMININAGLVPAITMKRTGLFLSEIVINVFEKNSNIKNIPAAVTVLNKASLERYNNESFVPAINTVPGVKMDERSPGSYRLSIRGNLLRSTFGVRNVKVYWNGIPFTDANGNTYFNELSLSNIGRIDILKGPSGSLYGAGTGGVVLLKSNLISVKEKSVTIQTTAGSYGTFAANVSYDRSDRNSISTLSFSHQQSDGYRVHTNMRRDVANYTSTFILNEKQHISANIFYSDLYYQTPGGLTQAEILKDPKQARPASGIFKSAEAQKAALYLRTLYAGFANEYSFNSKWNNTTAIYFSNTNFKNPTIRNYERKTEQGIGVRSVTKYQHKIFTGIFGGEYQYAFTNTSTFGNKLGQTDTLQIHDEIHARQFNIFLQADICLPLAFILSAGVSYNNFHYGFIRLNKIPAVNESSDFTPQFVPRISLLKKVKNRISIYASVSKGYSPPSIDEVHAGDGVFNKQLNAEKAINYETGFKVDIIQRKLFADISYYLFGLENTIVSRRDASGADYFVNAGKTRQQGFEASVNYTPFSNNNKFVRQINIWINYTNIHARFVNYKQGVFNYDGNKLTGTSPNVLVAGTDINTSAGLYTNLTYSFTDKIPLNDANSFYSNAYHLLFTRLGCKRNITKMIFADIFIAYNNSFNTPYSLGNDLNASSNRYFNPSAPQNLSGGIQIKFLLK